MRRQGELFLLCRRIRFLRITRGIRHWCFVAIITDTFPVYFYLLLELIETFRKFVEDIYQRTPIGKNLERL